MDSAYGRQCLDYFLSTISLRPTQYDVVLFNFGLHDIDYLDKYPEVCYLVLVLFFFVLFFYFEEDEEAEINDIVQREF